MNNLKLCTATEVARVIVDHVEAHWAQLWSAKPRDERSALKALVLVQCQRLTRPLERENAWLRAEVKRLRAITEGADVAMLQKSLSDAHAVLTNGA